MSRKKNPEKYNNLLKERRVRNREFILSYFKSHHCVDCGESNPVVLDFDHIGNNKSIDVSLMVWQTHSIKSIECEISKCEIRCSNCHRIVTAKRNPSHWINRINTE